ncbi:MAG: hypothetical protein UU46_C0036G0002 [Candidatus Uhrbacteria bacterium GW2011_GWD1_41_16]|uniref:Uncharacterized protein n=1 Tax=Candidatus Uhrbacteria bacterium GW2011_GWC1_41_20 TaxID=1618983 RepID=A0A0G0V939_9BACT|nr:MAG: hypothetical protein UT52_C0027G0002 [Candidatus Uhrbacteria bacterium GW2011_GWE1_39_46]KKR63111.1 MAG: hypothetical protein UU04_C0026G0002 [Candidatus Uhrbacteria bacterium GW2011_GWC2_40_450]KKR94246.1 MAG: hypothetical protein UU46_C0036G0002 [Candidatus Uhrbacteria bacterium GW2011_GWD1_41_16]KKR97553.1 MAG: hypothetical protein UU50_C0028G0002 [Candidatus Uhrbacteria bacterium GW2011_GWC1_41_20]KKS06628.1 MAG: hypothetical protein UU62_C0036G0002 [Candidatus Uhrbacteria bacterium
MKKVFTLVALLIALALTGCGDAEAEQPLLPGPKFVVLSERGGFDGNDYRPALYARDLRTGLCFLVIDSQGGTSGIAEIPCEVLPEME